MAVTEIDHQEADGADEEHSYSGPARPLHFRFRVDGRLYDEDFAESEFATKDPLEKAAIAVGQGSTFRQREEHYSLFIGRIINKGLAKQLENPAVERLLHQLVEAGVAENGRLPYRLTGKFFELFVKDDIPDEDEASGLDEKVSEEDEDTFDIIAPAKRPIALPKLIRKKGSAPRIQRGLLDVKQDKLNRKNINRHGGPRTLAILADLEAHNGSLTIDGPFDPYFRQKFAPHSSPGTFRVAIKKMAERGVVELSDDCKTLTLPDAGREQIALFKLYPEVFQPERPVVPVTEAALKIIETILAETGFEFTPDMTLDDLPETSAYLLPFGGFGSVNYRIASRMGKGVTEMSVRRIMANSNIKIGLFEASPVVNENGIDIGYQVRCLKPAIGAAFAAYREELAKEVLLDEVEVDEADQYAEACQHLAKMLGKLDEVEQLKSRPSLFELTPQQLASERERLEERFLQLQKEAKKLHSTMAQLASNDAAA